MRCRTGDLGFRRHRRKRQDQGRAVLWFVACSWVDSRVARGYILAVGLHGSAATLWASSAGYVSSRQLLTGWCRLTAGPKSTQLSMLFAPRLRANCARSRGVILNLPCFPSLRISRLSRAWPRSPRIAHSFSCSSSNSVVLSLSRAPAPSAASAGCWKLVLDESSRYELANHRFSSHSYSFISEIAPDGRFAVGRRRGTAQGSGCAPGWARNDGVQACRISRRLRSRGRGAPRRGCSLV